jgi:hypothetical protein
MSGPTANDTIPRRTLIVMLVAVLPPLLDAVTT